MNPQFDYIRLATWNFEAYLGASKNLSSRYKIRRGSWLQYKGHKSDDGRMFFGRGEQGRKPHQVVQFTGALAHDDREFWMGLSGAFYCTRLDLQVTILEPREHNGLQLYKRLHRKGKSYVESPGATTVYLGVRTSDLFTRIYEKEVTGERFLRCEFELKGRYAKATHDRLRRREITIEQAYQMALNQARVPEPHATWFATNTDETRHLERAESEESLRRTKVWLDNTEVALHRKLLAHDTRNMVLHFIERLELAAKYAKAVDGSA